MDNALFPSVNVSFALLMSDPVRPRGTVEEIAGAQIAHPATGLSTAPPDAPQGWRRCVSMVLTTLRTVGSSAHSRSILRTALMTVE